MGELVFYVIWGFFFLHRITCRRRAVSYFHSQEWGWFWGGGFGIQEKCRGGRFLMQGSWSFGVFRGMSRQGETGAKVIHYWYQLGPGKTGIG